MGDQHKPPEYLLRRNTLASARLNLLDYEIRNALGFALHPCIPTGAPALHIADVGTGTAHWLLDAAARLPTATCVGFDMDIRQAPPPAWLPPNVALHTWDATTPPAPRFCGAFDIVHVQLFMLVVRNDDPRPVLANLCMLLKPGGYLQWVELDRSTRAFHAAREGVSADRLRALCEYRDSLGVQDGRLSPTWVAGLGEAFRDMGLTVEVDYLAPYAPANWPVCTDLTFMVYEEFAWTLPSHIRDVFLLTLNAARTEVEASGRSVALTMDNRIVVGRKAGSAPRL